ncbi:MAG TPA: hypothetical protein VGC90_10155 [Candidatus Limnocylindrales bacterium]
MRAMSLVLADLAIRTAARPSASAPAEPVDQGPMWTPDRAAAWRAWASEGAAERALPSGPQSFEAAIGAPPTVTVAVAGVERRTLGLRSLRLIGRGTRPAAG